MIEPNFFGCVSRTADFQDLNNFKKKHLVKHKKLNEGNLELFYKNETIFFSNKDYDILIFGNTNPNFNKNSLTSNDIYSFLDRLDGNYSILFYNKTSDLLYIIQDKNGCYPIYYYYNKPFRVFCFSDRIKPIFSFFNNQFKPNDKIIRLFLSFCQTQYKTETFIEGIFKIPKYHLLMFDLKKDTLNLIFYPNVNSLKKFISNEKDAMITIKHLLTEHILTEYSSNSKGPIHLLLSGGLDSSIIASILVSQNIEFTAHSLIFPGNEKIDESKNIQKLAKNLGIANLRTLSLTPEDFYNHILKTMEIQEELFYSTSVLGQYLLLKSIKKPSQNQSIISGEGADFLFFGQDKAIAHVYFHYFKNLKIKSFFEFLINSNLNRKRYFLFALTPNLVSNPILDHFFIKANEVCSTIKHTKEDLEYFNKIMSFKSKKLEVLRIYYDLTIDQEKQSLGKNTKYFGFKLVTPFLNEKLKRYVANLPLNLLVDKGYGKYILRKSFEDSKIPKEIIWQRDKLAFCTPQREWFKQPSFKDFVENLFEDQKSVNYIDKTKFLNYIDLYQKGKKKYDFPIWSAICLEGLLKTYFSQT